MSVFKWIKRLAADYYIYKKHLNPKQAKVQSRKVNALIYAILSWQIFGIVIYSFVDSRLPKDPTDIRRNIDSNGPSETTVFQVRGLTLVNEFTEKLEADPEEYVEHVSQD